MKDYLAHILKPEVQRYIIGHERADVQQLVLKHRQILGVPSSWIATQIAGRSKAREKLPLWYQTTDIVYPPALNLEQCSSELTARYKQGLMRGHRAVDLTGGFGVDTYFLSQVFETIDYVEPDEFLLEIARHNHQQLGAPQIRYHHLTAEQFVKSDHGSFDLFYLDPSRRTGSRKVIRLADSTPDVVAMERALKQAAREVIIKASPMLDLSHAMKELPAVDQVIVLASEGECKELLLIIRRGTRRIEPTLHAVNLQKDGEPMPFAFTHSQEVAARVPLGGPQTYLYEPNAAILKAGGFKLVGQRFGLTKLAKNSHLYTAEEKYDDFPGRIFQLIEQVSLDRKLTERFSDGQANLIARNYPLSVEEIKKKTGLIEGGSAYLICTTTERPIALIAKRLR